ncbi:hypothetical protein U1Q18_048956 [Sarracenia purpurea var. burkii]
MARYPVIYLDLAGFARTSPHIDHVRLEIMSRLSKTLDPYMFFKNHAKLYARVENFTSLRFSKSNMQFIETLMTKNLSSVDLRRSLVVISRSLYEYFNRTKVIIVIDEFDGTAVKSPLLKSSYVADERTEN